MRRISPIFLFGIVLLTIIILSACNLTTLPAVEEYNQTATSVMVMLATQMAATPTETEPPPPTPTPTSTLDPFQLLTLTPFDSSAYLTPIVNRPTVYTLQPGEFPYCIARRFDVEPKELLALNNLRSGMIYHAGLTLSIPQTGKPFPPPRALRSHPAAYTVQESQMTVFKIACLFGEVDPALIMQANHLTSTILPFGTTIQIP